MDNGGKRVCFITGGASGIGLGLARALGSHGVAIALTDIDTTLLNVAVQQLRSEGVTVRGFPLDVTDYEAFVKAAESVRQTFGNVDILCNSAGVALEGPVDSWSTAGWRWVLDVNVIGVVNGVRSLAPMLAANPNGGHIVNIASIGGLIGAGQHGQYAASKFAVVGLSQSLREELAPSGIGVTVVCPGFVRSSIASAGRNAPPDLVGRQEWLMSEGFSSETRAFFKSMAERIVCGLDPLVVGHMIREAIARKDFYVFTEVEFLDEVERRQRWVVKAINRTRGSTDASR